MAIGQWVVVLKGRIKLDIARCARGFAFAFRDFARDFFSLHLRSWLSVAAATGPSFFSAKKEAKNSSLGYSATVGSASTCKPQNLLGDIFSCTEGCCVQSYGNTVGAGTGLGGRWQLPAAGPSHPKPKAPKVRIGISESRKRRDGTGGEGRLGYALDGRQRAATGAAKP